MIVESCRQYWFPNCHAAPHDAPLAFGGDLSAGRLISAYARGIFPWFSEEEPILWWCPDPRFVLIPEEIQVSDSLSREIRRPVWRITMDEAFSQVITECARQQRPGQDGTWITGEMADAYTQLHKLGFAHSVECWRENELVGGLYGVSLGKVFFGESMFYKHSNASKVAFVHFVKQLEHWNFEIIDCQVPTAHLQSFGARCISREQFLKKLEVLVFAEGHYGNWQIR